ncbi:MAG: hypothetical protein WC738_07580, partial [Candidatus Omnitrophota bacterium]
VVVGIRKGSKIADGKIEELGTAIPIQEFIGKEFAGILYGQQAAIDSIPTNHFFTTFFWKARIDKLDAAAQREFYTKLSSLKDALVNGARDQGITLDFADRNMETFGHMFHRATLKEEGFDFDEFTKATRFIASTPEFKNYLESIDSYRMADASGKTVLFTRQAFFFAEHMIRNGLSQGEIRDVMNAQADLMKGQSYEQVEKKMGMNIFVTKSIEYGKMLLVMLGIAGIMASMMALVKRARGKKEKRAKEGVPPQPMAPPAVEEAVQPTEEGAAQPAEAAKEAPKTEKAAAPEQKTAAAPEQKAAVAASAPAVNLLPVMDKISKMSFDIDDALWEASRKLDPERYKLAIRITLGDMDGQFDPKDKAKVHPLINIFNVWIAKLIEKEIALPDALKDAAGNPIVVTPANYQDVLLDLRNELGDTVVALVTFDPNESFAQKYVAKYAANRAYEVLLSLEEMNNKEKGIEFFNKSAFRRYAPRDFTISPQNLKFPKYPLTGLSKVAGVIMLAYGFFGFIVRGYFDSSVGTVWVFAAGLALMLLGSYFIRFILLEAVKDILDSPKMPFAGRVKKFFGLQTRSDIAGGVIDDLTKTLEGIRDRLKMVQDNNKAILPADVWEEITTFSVQAPLSEPQDAQTAQTVTLNIDDYLQYTIDWLKSAKNDPAAYKLFARGHFPWYDPQFFFPTIYMRGEEFNMVESGRGMPGIMPGTSESNRGLGYAPLADPTKFNGPTTHRDAIHAIPANNVPYYIGALQYRIR